MNNSDEIHNFPKVSRIEVISEKGREYVNHDCNKVSLCFQDEGRTVKLFMFNESRNPFYTAEDVNKFYSGKLQNIKSTLKLGDEQLPPSMDGLKESQKVDKVNKKDKTLKET